jgi:drug/metabolite transporter (DMT)-like permease
MTDLSRGYLYGFIGVAIFALTLPLTRIAVVELNPLFLSLGRTVLAACAAGFLLWATKQPWPEMADLRRLVVVAAGVVFGFPVLSALAMQHVPASHGGVVLGLLPLATAAMGTIVAGEKPSAKFWLWGIAGSIAVIVFAIKDSGFTLQWGDALLFAALLAAALGYATGGALSRKLGGWQVISWALIISVPLTLPLAIWYFPKNATAVSSTAWLCFLYLALMSQFIGFFAWNKGLAIGGVAKVGQVQLLQTFMTIAAAAFINAEPLSSTTIGFALIVAGCVYLGRRATVKTKQES